MLSRAHLQLTWELAKREMFERYAGNSFGLVWTFIQPLTLMLTYLVVFGVVLRLRMPDDLAARGTYALYFLSGFASWVALSETISKGSTIILQHASLVKQIVFPIEVLPIKSVIATAITQLIILALILIYMMWCQGEVRLMHVMIVPALAAQFFLMVGITYVLSAFGVYFRDLKDVMQIFLAMGIFITPVVYSPHLMTGAINWVIHSNPLSYAVFCFQDVIFFGRFEHPRAWIVLFALAAFFYFVGRTLFKRLEHFYGDAL